MLRYANSVTDPRPALRYFGAKWRLAPWIQQYFPTHVCYVEPYAGSAAVLLQKPHSEIEILNDIDQDVVTFFQVLRETPQELLESIKNTPYSRAEYKKAWDPVEKPLERARRLYVRSWQGWGGGSRYGGWRYQHRLNRGKSVVADWNRIDQLWLIAERLKDAFIECDEALNIIERYDTQDTLFYLDPPYLKTTRSEHRTRYVHDMEREDHVALLETIQRVQGMVVLSGLHSALYDEWLSDWHTVEKSARTTNPDHQTTETLWLSPAAVGRLPRQTTFIESLRFKVLQ